MIRHTKNQVLSGEQVLQLPPKTEEDLAVVLTEVRGEMVGGWGCCLVLDFYPTVAATPQEEKNPDPFTLNPHQEEQELYKKVYDQVKVRWQRFAAGGASTVTR